MFEFVINMLRPMRFRGKARLLRRLLPDWGLRRANVFGYRMELDIGEHIQRMIYLGAYEAWETRMVARHLRPGMTFVDVGANVGYFTLLAARRVGPHGRVFAVEPSAYAADRLQQTLRENSIHNVVVGRFALGRAPASSILYTPCPDNYTPNMLGEPGSPGTVVPVRTLDDCLSEWQVVIVDLLKMDVEGFEPAVLDGAVAALREKCVRAMLCELNDFWLRRAGTNSEEFYRRILEAGFVDADGTRPPRGGCCNRFFLAACEQRGQGQTC